jgi:hypothetical protein
MPSTWFMGCNNAFNEWNLHHYPIDVMINKDLAENYKPRYFNELIRRGQKDQKVVKALEDASTSSNISIASQTTYALYRLGNNPEQRVKALIQMLEKDPSNITVGQVIGFGFNQADFEYLPLFEPMLDSENPDVVEFGKAIINTIKNEPPRESAENSDLYTY